MNVNLGTVVASHLNDVMIEMHFDTEIAKKRIKFVKAITFFNENLERDVTVEYLDYMWNEIENGNCGSKFVKGTDYKNLKK